MDSLYAAFAHYPLRRDMPACSCCVSPADLAQLAAAPLPQLTPDQLDLYATKAMTTWGDVQDYKHFLPRLVDIAFSGEGVSIDFENLANKLTYADWWSWPPDEQEALSHALLERWNVLLGTDAEVSLCEPREVLGALDRLEEDLLPYLDAWAAHGSPHATMHLALLIENGEWRWPSALRTWVQGPACRSKLETAPAPLDVSAALERWQVDWGG